MLGRQQEAGAKWPNSGNFATHTRCFLAFIPTDPPSFKHVYNSVDTCIFLEGEFPAAASPQQWSLEEMYPCSLLLHCQCPHACLIA